jgi:hypothetical protein
MKKAALFIICFLATGLLNAQDFRKGGNYVNLGYGLDPWGSPLVTSTFGTVNTSNIGPIMLMYERGVTDVLGIGRIGAGGGLAQSFYTQKYTYLGIEERNHTSRTSLIARATYHFEFDIPKLDVYAGVGGGLHIYSDKKEDYNPFDSNSNTDGFVVTRETRVGGVHYVFAGAKYYFTEAFGVYLEAGHGLVAFNGGLAFAF